MAKFLMTKQKFQNQWLRHFAGNLSKEQFENYMMATGKMATDVGTILYGKEAVSCGLIDRLGGISDALSALHKMIDKGNKGRQAGKNNNL